MLKLAQSVTLSHVSENWEGSLTEETMLVTVTGHIFHFTKKYAINQLLMKKIYLFATFFLSVWESHLHSSDDEQEPQSSFRTLHLLLQPAGNRGNVAQLSRDTAVVKM